MHSRKIRMISMTGNAILLTLLSGCDDARLQVGNITDTGLPSPLTVAETIHASVGDGVCDAGGIRLVYGLDHNHDGRVGPYESLGTEYLCNPTEKQQNGPRVVTIGESIPEADKERILRALSRS